MDVNCFGKQMDCDFFRKNNGLKDLLYGLWHTILHRCDEQEVTSNKRGSGITFIIVKTLHF